MPIERKPRFRRSANPRPFQLTQRDLDIIRYVSRYRLLNSDQIIRLIQGSPQNVLRRLRLLYDHRYLDRPLSQLEYFTSGSRAMIYGTGRNNFLKRPFIQHTLTVSDILVMLECACRESGFVQFIDRELALQQIHHTTGCRQLKWNVSSIFEGLEIKLGIVPDYVFGLRLQGSNDEPVYYFLELDRGTMPVMRKDLSQSSLYRKLLAYHETWRLGLHTSLFGLKRFRVMILTNGEERLDRIVATSEMLGSTRGSQMFLFANILSTKHPRDILIFPLINGCREEMTTLARDILALRILDSL